MIWDKLSPFYDMFEKAYNGKVFKGIAAEIKNYINENDYVLECACGTGLLSVPIAQKCKRLIATDYSLGMLKQSKRKLAGFDNVMLRRVSIPDLPFKDNSFNAVVAANVIHLLDDPDRALAEMTRVCRPGGRIIIPTYINEQKKNAVIAAKLLSKTGVNFKRQFNFESYKNFFTDHGFENVTFRVVEGHMPCAFAIIENKKKITKQVI